MFGGDLVPPPRCKRKVKNGPAHQDILNPSLVPGYYGHYARQPNTDQHVRMLHYQQKKEAFDHQHQENLKNQIKQEAIESKYEQHVMQKRLQRSIQDRVKEKLKKYEETVEERRKKLHDLLCKEERQFYLETVDAALKGADQKMEEMKQKAQMLKARRERDRLEIVQQKRIEQYKERCQELRPHLFKKNLIECKNTQLQQIRENEARREADRELDKMWHDLTMKEIEAKKEREIQDMLQRREKQKGMLDTWAKQIKGKELWKKEMDKAAQEDKIEMEKLGEQLRREEIEALDAKRRKRDETAKQFLEQIEIHRQRNAQRKKEDDAFDEVFHTMARLEAEREKAAIEDATSYAKNETAMYRKHLKELEAERKQEEKQLMELLEIHRKEIEKKQDEARCKIIEAKRKLQRDVLSERAEQIKYKKQEAEQQLKLKEAENELLRMAFETNERLQAESDRLEHQAVIQYREDLRKQIEYNNVLRKRGREELERQLAEGQKEEEKFRQIVQEMLGGDIEITAKHPFRRALEQTDCYCKH